MATCEHLHKKFVDTSTAGLTILTILDDSFEENPSEFIHKVFNTYHKKAQESPANGKLHDAFRTLLSYEYQLKVADTSHSTARNFNENLLKNLKNNLLHPDVNDENIRAILDDVAILQIVLHLNLDDIDKLFKETLEFTTEEINKGKNLQNYLPIIENLVNAVCLRQMLKIDHEKSQELRNNMELFLPAIKSWFLIISENNPDEWRPFLSILFKLTSAFPDVFVHFSWILVTEYRPEHSDKRSLTFLCGIIDNLLPSSSKSSIVSINLSFCFNENILSLISNHLVSNVQSSRRQAQYVLRRIVDFSRECPHDLLHEHKDTPLKPPFVFSGDTNLNIKEIKRKYFSLLETLEVKQAARVFSEVNLLDDLLDASIPHDSLIDITWIRCIFTRLLNHDNTTVVTAGLITALRMEIQIFDDEFITLLTKSLNHTFLYDNQNSDPQPKILEELSEFFFRAENNKKNFISRFILSASRVNWSPIPLFYVLEALGNHGELSQVKHNVWDCEELEALSVIAKEYIKHQIKLMQIPTKMNILKCITIYVKSPLDLRALEQIFSSIRSEGFLKRDNKNWGIITRYLKENMQESSALKFISESCELLKSEDEDRINSLALLIVLLYDSGSPFFKASVSSNSLGKLFSSLADSYKNPADSLGFSTSLQMIISLMELSPKASDTYVSTIFGFSEFILNSIWNGTRSRLPQSHKESLIYVDTISAMFKLRVLSPNFTQSITNMMKIEEEEVKRMNDVINSDNTPLLHSSYLLNILDLSDKASDEYSREHIINEADEKLIQEFHYLITKIHHRRIILSSEQLPEEFYRKFLVEKLIILAETQSYDAIPLITKILESIINKLEGCQKTMNNCEQIILDIINICWKNLWNMKRAPDFWKSARHLIKLLFTDSFLKVARFRAFVVGYVDYIISRSGDNTSPLRFILFEQINTMSGQNILLFGQAILSSILQTHAGKSHHKRIEMQTCLYIVKTTKIDFSDENLMTGLGIYTDVTTRALLVIMILKLGNKMEHREGKELIFIYVPQLISLLVKKKNEICFRSSDVHRVKYRIMQVLLLLNLQEDSAKEVHDTLCGLLLTENNLPNVRIIQEWVLARIYVENEKMTDLIWTLFPSLRKDQPESLMSLISIVYHVAKGLCPKEKLVYVKKAMQYILPNCFAEQSEVQFHSQRILLRLFELVDDISLEHLAKYKCLRKAMEENLQSGRVKIRALEMKEDLSTFDAIGDFNLQTIFYDVPRLCDMAMDEWIDPALFDSLLPEYLKVQWFHYYKNGGKLVEKKSKILEDADAIEDSNLLDISQEEVLADVDAEIIPQLTNAEVFLPRSRMLRQTLIINDIGLIVIASLIKDLASLGSLARTAEIFYGRELVLEGKTYTENEDFQRLSVTAEKWITILEVKPQELRDYLLQKKSMGWKLVGVEHTLNSVNLFDMKFDERTVLLLGNEKNGIPANLIQLMDTCVEIPQAGVASPPNVHVTGAICMCQYAQQHLF